MVGVPFTLGLYSRRQSHILIVMLSFLVALVVVGMFSETQSLAETVADAAMVGTWRVEPTTYVVVPNMGNPSGIGRMVRKDGTEVIFEGSSILATLPEAMPTNFAAFALLLKANGSFVATNVPGDFFFSRPWAKAEGTWELGDEPALWIYGKTNQYFHLHFSQPLSKEWVTEVVWSRLGSSSSRLPLLHIFVGKHRQVCLTKQRDPDVTNAAPLNLSGQLNNHDNQGAAPKAAPPPQ